MYDGLSIFLTQWSIKKFAADLDSLVHARVKNNESVYGWSPECLLQNHIPSVTTRFPRLSDKTVAPLLFDMPRTTTFNVPASKITHFTDEQIEDMRVYLSGARGKKVLADDQEVVRRLRDACDGGLSGVSGNMFKVSTWRQHAYHSLRSRGRCDGSNPNDVVMQRIYDSGNLMYLRKLVQTSIQEKTKFEAIFDFSSHVVGCFYRDEDLRQAGQDTSTQNRLGMTLCQTQTFENESTSIMDTEAINQSMALDAEPIAEREDEDMSDAEGSSSSEEEHEAEEEEQHEEDED
tara:strand:+ start:1 stop:870 length:870 start_codon:yes stop_codon:yes gene_type:complete